MKKDLFIAKEESFTGRFFYEEGEDRIAKLEFEYTNEEFDEKDESINVFKVSDIRDENVAKKIPLKLADRYFRFKVLEDENLIIEFSGKREVLVKYDYKYGWIIKCSYNLNPLSTLVSESRTLPIGFIPYKESLFINYVIELLDLQSLLIEEISSSNVTCNLVGYLHMFFKHHEPRQTVNVNTGLNITLSNTDELSPDIDIYPMKGISTDPNEVKFRLNRVGSNYYMKTYDKEKGYKVIAHAKLFNSDTGIRFIRSILAYYGYGLDDIDIEKISKMLFNYSEDKEFPTYSKMGQLEYLELDNIVYVQNMIPIIQCNY